jgi:hypothetical protein
MAHEVGCCLAGETIDGLRSRQCPYTLARHAFLKGQWLCATHASFSLLHGPSRVIWYTDSRRVR